MSLAREASGEKSAAYLTRQQFNKSNVELHHQLYAAIIQNRPSVCVPQVLLLSFTLILLPSLKPFAETKVSQPGDFIPLRGQSTSPITASAGTLSKAL